jgi:hypothetical protein
MFVDGVGAAHIPAARQRASMPFGDGQFDSAYKLHVGMNIENKEHLTAELARASLVVG